MRLGLQDVGSVRYVTKGRTPTLRSSPMERPQLYRFLDAGNTEAGRTLGEAASKKRRCTKSRDAGQRLGGEHYGDFSLALHLMEADPGAR
jgi:hypothetical protein